MQLTLNVEEKRGLDPPGTKTKTERAEEERGRRGEEEGDEE